MTVLRPSLPPLSSTKTRIRREDCWAIAARPASTIESADAPRMKWRRSISVLLTSAGKRDRAWQWQPRRPATGRSYRHRRSGHARAACAPAPSCPRRKASAPAWPHLLHCGGCGPRPEDVPREAAPSNDPAAGQTMEQLPAEHLPVEGRGGIVRHLLATVGATIGP